MAIREGRWDCTSCGAAGLRASEKSCSSCGSPRADDVKFYLPDDAEEVTDAQQLAEAKAGADWYCEFCAAGNTNTVSVCKGCGAPKGDSTHHAVTDIMNDAPAAPVAAIVSEPQQGGGMSKILAGCCAAVAAIALLTCCLLGGLGMTTKDVQVEVSGFSWTRTITVQEYRTVQEQGWSVPSGGRQLRTERKVHHHDKVPDGTVTKTRQKKVQVGTKTVKVGKRDLGNGYFEDITREEPVYESQTETYQEQKYREEPVYQTYYTYEIDKWVDLPVHSKSGSDHTPVWPEVTVQEGKQREGGRTERYVVNVRDPAEGKTYEKELDLETWQRWETGQKLYARITGLGALEALSDQPPKKD